MIFARIQADNLHACGVFANQSEAADVLFSCAESRNGSSVIHKLHYQHYPEEKMSTQDYADAGAMVAGAVVVL